MRCLKRYCVKRPLDFDSHTDAEAPVHCCFFAKAGISIPEEFSLEYGSMETDAFEQGQNL